MKKSKDKKVQKFFDDLLALDNEKFDILQKLRAIVFKQYPDVDERMMYGGIMFSLAEDFGGLFVSKHHVSFEFSNGYQLKDPKKILEGTGKYRRHLKITSLADITGKDVEFFVKQIKSK